MAITSSPTRHELALSLTPLPTRVISTAAFGTQGYGAIWQAWIKIKRLHHITEVQPLWPALQSRLRRRPANHERKYGSRALPRPSWRPLAVGLVAVPLLSDDSGTVFACTNRCTPTSAITPSDPRLHHHHPLRSSSPTVRPSKHRFAATRNCSRS